MGQSIMAQTPKPNLSWPPFTRGGFSLFEKEGLGVICRFLVESTSHKRNKKTDIPSRLPSPLAGEGRVGVN
jgi:hypothetical protein